MKQVQHTHGEWFQHPTAGDHDIDVYSGDTGKTVALVIGYDEEAKANALLIEHAPELLKALKAWQTWADLQQDIPNDRLPKIHDTAKRIIYDIETLM